MPADQSYARRMLYEAIDTFGERAMFPSHDLNFPTLLEQVYAEQGRFFVVQIGANDGVLYDPIYDFVTRHAPHVSGVMVEPVPDYFARLQVNYRDYPQIQPVQAAIHKQQKEMTIYRVDPQMAHLLPAWAQGIASFNPQHHVLSETPAKYMRAQRVPCLTLSELLQRYGVQALDLLQIDTEGYDAEIIASLDFARFRPRLLRFEHGLPDRIMSKAVFFATLQRLIDQGYRLLFEEYDALAY